MKNKWKIVAVILRGMDGGQVGRCCDELRKTVKS